MFRSIAVAYVLLGLLALIATVGESLYLWRTIPTLTGMAWQADQSTYFAGDVARQINDVQVILAHGVHRRLSGGEMTGVAKGLMRVNRSMARLQPMLDEEDFAVFSQLTGRVAELHGAITRALAAMAAGNQAGFVTITESESLEHIDRIQPLLDRLIALNQQESERLLKRLRHQLQFVDLVTTIAGVSFVLVLVVVAIATLRHMYAQEAALGSQLDRLEHSNRDLAAFAGRVAHDLRAPLAPILLAAEELERASTNAMARGLAGRIVHASRRAARLIESLLAFSRAGTPTGAKSRSRRVVLAAVAELHEATEASRVDLRVTLDDVILPIDESLLQQLAQNLLSNAIRFAGHRGPPVVAIELRATASSARLEVSDNGPGVPPDERGHVFEPFFRLDRRGPGIGLGLATVRRIAEAHGGRCGVDERPGGGAAVWVELPLVEPQPAPAPFAAVEQQPVR